MPASSWVDVINDALIELGCNKIFDYSDDSKEARVCSERYPYSVEAVLQMKKWKSVAVRANLAQLSVAPLFGFAYAYALPVDYIRMILPHPDMGEHKVEGRSLLTNNAVAQIIYVQNPTSPVFLSPLLSKTISMFLAWNVGYALVQEPRVIPMMEKKFKDMYRQAKNSEAFEDSTVAWEAVELLTARLAGPGYDGVSELSATYNF